LPRPHRERETANRLVVPVALRQPVDLDRERPRAASGADRLPAPLVLPALFHATRSPRSLAAIARSDPSQRSLATHRPDDGRANSCEPPPSESRRGLRSEAATARCPGDTA